MVVSRRPSEEHPNGAALRFKRYYVAVTEISELGRKLD
jgi:hypothetical protein